MDRLFERLIRPGNRIELFDGLHSKEALESSLFAHFDGTLDLTTCTSTIVCDYISRVRRNRVRTVQYPAVQEFVWCAHCVMLALRMVSESGRPCQEARLMASEIVAAAAREIAKEAKKD